MAIFSDCSVVLDLKNVPYKEKKKLMSAVVDSGGHISYVVNKNCSFVVASSLENISSSRWRSAVKHQIPVVSPQYVWSCLEKGLLLPVQEHVLTSSEHTPHPAGLKSRDQLQTPNSGIQVKDGTYLGQLRLYKKDDPDIPDFPSDFQVAKYFILVLAHPKTWSVLELQSAKGQAEQQYRVVSSIMHEAEKSSVWDKQVHSCSSEDALEAFLMLRKELQVQGFTEAWAETLPPWAEKLTSHGLQQLLLEEKLNCSTVSQDVGVFLELIWSEALGSLSSILTVPVTSISLNDVSRVEGLLLQVQKSNCEHEVKGLLEEVDTLLPLRRAEHDSRSKMVSQKLDLCQLIRDILNMTEATLGNPYPSSLGKYRALRCSIEQVPSESPEYLSVCQLLQDRPAQIQQILRVNRGTELHMFRSELGNIKPLLHSTAPSSLVGILSRGLLLPRVAVEQHGIERTDIGNLGSGIYFSDSLNTSVKYSKPSVTDGCRLLLVCEVALGQCKDQHKRDFTLTSSPEGYDSVHAVRRTPRRHSDFEDDEYVVYNTDQIRLKYVVQYILSDDEVKDFQPYVDTTLAPLNLSSPVLTDDDSESLAVIKNPLEDVTAGLLDSNGQTLPLQAVHVRCKLMDLLSQVVIFQTYTNNSSVPIEAKYVFPLEETAAVCGFEAFINGKHVIGKVKEKEQARKEYKQAIEKGHGAYLMDQDAPDVFTISVGNLPPEATVLIKVTFITELVVRAGTIVFSLPGSVAPWQQSSALNQRTQTTVEKVCVNELQPDGEFSLSMSIEMPYEIINLECSHQISLKRTDCKAVVSTLPDQTLSTDGFRLSFSLFQIHMPRMWVEKHPEKDTEACMLVFYPHFESSGSSVSDVSDVIIVLDTSESMRGDAVLNARRIALKMLNSLDRSLRVNIISFGSDYKEAFHSPTLLEDSFEEAKNFILTSAVVGGSTELWRPLRTLNLLPPSRGVRNVLLISDGHVQNQPQTLQLVRNNVRHTRLFTCGLNVTANRYMLRALAQAGGGTYEFFDTKKKHNWAEKVNSQVRCMLSPGCTSVAVKWQQFNPTAPSPVQAPSQLHALFSERHTLVYGFVPHCTQATLFGDLSGQEIETMVSTTELQKTKGTFLHKLTARAVIKDYEDGSLGSSEAEHEGKKAELKSYIIELSKEYSILSQFTSFVAVEERDQEQPDSGFTDVPKIIAEEDVDILPYMSWTEQKQSQESDSEYSGGDYEEQESDSSGGDYEAHVEMDFSEMDFGPWPMGGRSLRRHLTRELEHEEEYVPATIAFRARPNLKSKTKICMNESDRPMHLSPTPAFRSDLRQAHQLRMHHIRSRTMSGSSCDEAPPDDFSQANYISTPTPPHPEISTDGVGFETLLRQIHQLQVQQQGPPVMARSLRDQALPPAFSQANYLSAPAPPHSNLFTDGVGFGSCLRLTQQVQMLQSAPVMAYSLRDQAPPPAFSQANYLSAPTPPNPELFTEGVGFGARSLRFGFAASAASVGPPPPPVMRSAALQKSAYVAAPAFLSSVGSIFSSEGHAPALPSVPCSARVPLSFDFAAPASPPPSAGPPLPGVCGPPAPPLLQGSVDTAPPTYFSDVAFEAAVSKSFDFVAPAPSPPPPPPQRARRRPCRATCFRLPEPVCDDILVSGLSAIEHSLDTETVDSNKGLYRSMKKKKLVPRCSPPERISWEELFNLQHQDGYWECTGALNRFLGLDVDFFANVFLKEKGISSLGVKAHADILKLVATLLVLQLMRVKKIEDVELLQSLFRLTDHPEPRPACWDAVKRAVEWVCWADRQYPCVCSRLEFGWDWESCTRQLLRLDSVPPFSPLIPVLQRDINLQVM